jgi:hypothetical protein
MRKVDSWQGTITLVWCDTHEQPERACVHLVTGLCSPTPVNSSACASACGRAPNTHIVSATLSMSFLRLPLHTLLLFLPLQHEIHHPKAAENPYPELQHQVETGRIEVGASHPLSELKLRSAAQHRPSTAVARCKAHSIIICMQKTCHICTNICSSHPSSLQRSHAV